MNIKKSRGKKQVSRKRYSIDTTPFYDRKKRRQKKQMVEESKKKKARDFERPSSED